MRKAFFSLFGILWNSAFRCFYLSFSPLLFNMLSRLVITFLPRSKGLLISWLQSPSAVILEQKDKVQQFPGEEGGAAQHKGAVGWWNYPTYTVTWLHTCENSQTGTHAHAKVSSAVCWFKNQTLEAKISWNMHRWLFPCAFNDKYFQSPHYSRIP